MKTSQIFQTVGGVEEKTLVDLITDETTGEPINSSITDDPDPVSVELSIPKPTTVGHTIIYLP